MKNLVLKLNILFSNNFFCYKMIQIFAWIGSLILLDVIYHISV